MLASPVLVIHSHEHGWDSVRYWLGRLAGGLSFAEVTRAIDAVRAMETLDPQSILCSDVLEGEPSYPLLADLRARTSSSALISIFASTIDPVLVHHFAQLNLSGYFEWKHLTSSEAVATAVRVSLTPGLICGTPSIVRMYFQINRAHAGQDLRLPMSARQQEVLKLLVVGHSHQEIANQLVCSPRTVTREIDAAKDILQADNVHDLVMKATLRGLLP